MIKNSLLQSFTCSGRWSALKRIKKSVGDNEKGFKYRIEKRQGKWTEIKQTDRDGKKEVFAYIAVINMHG